MSLYFMNKAKSTEWIKKLTNFVSNGSKF